MRRRLLLVQGGFLLLSGCGFQLRGAAVFAFDSIYLDGRDNSLLVEEIRRSLDALGAIRVVSDAGLRDTAQVVLDIVSDQREKNVVGVNSNGQVLEFQLRMRVRFRLRSAQGRELLPETELVQLRDISYSETSALAKESEEVLMYRDMQTEIVQQLVRRLAAVTVA